MAINALDIPLVKTLNNLGGAPLADQIATGVLQNLFDIVGPLEARDGSVEYACIYIKNLNLVDTFRSVAIQKITDSLSPTTSIAIGLGTAVVGTTEQTIADKFTAPSGVVFEEAERVELSIGNMLPETYKAVWVRRTVLAGSATTISDASLLRVTGDLE